MKRSHQVKTQLHRQRGSTAIWFALCLPVLLGFAALAVDLARINLTKVELQNAADSAALAGARSLTPLDASTYNWTAAKASALDVAKRNVANGELIKDADITTGYWNLGSGNVPFIRATVTISSTQNNGPLKLFFAPILGITDKRVQATAVAVITTPANGTGVFPFVIERRFLEKYWDTSTGKPIMKNGEAPTVELGSIYASSGKGNDKVDSLSGQWTTFNTTANDVKFVDSLITYGNGFSKTTTSLGINDKTYVQPGDKASVYRDVPIGKDVAMFVVDSIVKKDYYQIVAIAAFHITDYNQGKKTILGHFVPASIIPGLNPGNGNGVFYGAYTPPLLVE